MNQLAPFSGIKMDHLEIANLVHKRPDNVKRTIESLIDTGVISHPQIEDGIKSANGVIPKIYVFSGEQGKRDSIIVVAQLCPEFTARLVDRWQDLETENHSLEQTINTITQTPAGVKFQQACKILNIKQAILANWLRQHSWDRKLNNTRASTYYSQERGYCETKYEEVARIRPNGDPYTFTKIEFFILPKGMQVLAKFFGKAD